MSRNHSYGKSLPDQVDRIADFFAAHLALVGDVREIYQEQVTLEREYAGKLQALAMKAAEKKRKMSTLVAVGADPAKPWDERTSATQSTLLKAYNEVIKAMACTAQAHSYMADVMNSQVVDAFKTLERKNGNLAKRELQFFHKLLSDRDRAFSECLKNKQKYDEDCREVIIHHQKQVRAHDGRRADRAAMQYDQQRIDMLNSKNLYVLSTIKANNVKAMFYDENVPNVENTFQSLQVCLVKQVIKIWLHSQALQLTHFDNLKGQLSAVVSALEEVNPFDDQEIFIDHNIRTFVAPSDWIFEPCAVHQDSDELSVEAVPKTVLQNKLSRCRAKLQELTPKLIANRDELNKYSKGVDAYTSEPVFGDIDDVFDDYLEIKQQLLSLETSTRLLNAEIETIVTALDNDEGAQQPHTFASSLFSIPTLCTYCKSSIWGLKQGKTCQLCGISAHSKCELKVPAECIGSGGRTNSTTVSQGSIPVVQDRPSGASVPKPMDSSIVGTTSEEFCPMARILFDFSANSEFELNVLKGTLVHVHEGEDGSGWVKVANDLGGKGLVPASYIELLAFAESQNPMDSEPLGQYQYVRGIHSYIAQGPDELAVAQGELIKLSNGAAGGQNYGDGWWEGINSRGEKGFFPSNYVELI